MISKSVLFIFLSVFIASLGNGETICSPRAKIHSKARLSTAVIHPFALGADVSWLTEMEAKNYTFYDSTGTQRDCMELLKSMGINAIRLRVWVNPPDGWCNTKDFLIKAKRANKLGMKILVDFHYSDSWADPGKQTKPDAWKKLSLKRLTRKVYSYTREVLKTLKKNDITPQWVQVGNETTYGMLWDKNESVSGAITANNGKNYTLLSNAGYKAVKSVFPSTKVVVHIDRGQLQSLSKQLFDAMLPYGGKFDVLGFSLYPAAGNWRKQNKDCLKNMQWVVDHYGKEVMICEAGMQWDQQDSAKAFLSDLIQKTRSVKNASGKRMGLGIFYWEPECYNWKGYSKGAFNPNGTPTRAMDAFLENKQK